MGKCIKSEDLERKEDHVGHAAADPVGDGCPKDTSGAIHDTDDTDKGGCLGRTHADDLLRHGRSHGKKADAAGDIREEDPPQHIPFPCVHGLLARETFGLSCLFPILSDLFLKHLFQKHRDLTLPRRPDVGGGKDHDQRIGSGEDEEILREPEAIDKIAHGRACNERCEAEPHDGQPRRKAAMPGKPFHKRRDRRDIARTKTNAPDGSVKEIEQESGLTVNRRRCPKETRTEKDGRDHPAPGRPQPLDQRA